MNRLYAQIIKWHMQHDQQMLFIAGARQVGKTTISQAIATETDKYIYMNWDRTAHRQIIIRGVDETAQFAQLAEPSEQLPIIVFDEIHKYSKWKNFLKGFYDTYKGKLHIIVTGSAKLDLYKHGSDSLLGRYFPYRIHPLSVAECLQRDMSDTMLHAPSPILQEQFNALWTNGGFPEPFLKNDRRFHHRWQNNRIDRLFTDDIRQMTQIQEIQQMQILTEFIHHQVGGIINRSELAKKIGVAVTTIKRWLAKLEQFYYLFLIPPWTKNVPRSLIKEPKVFLWDWSELTDPGKRAENLIASHLLKAVHYWNDSGLGDFGLYYIRNKNKQEVDFVVTSNNNPWFLVEVKHGNNHAISKSLHHFQEKLQVPHAFQVVIDKPYVDIDCFSYSEPIIVSAMTLLSQLV